MKTAKLIKKKDLKTRMGFTAEQKHYQLSEPLDGHQYVVVSAAYTPDHGPETYIFGANKKGEIIEWGELSGSFVGEENHEQALNNAGYEVDSE